MSPVQTYPCSHATSPKHPKVSFNTESCDFEDVIKFLVRSHVHFNTVNHMYEQLVVMKKKFYSCSLTVIHYFFF